VILARFLTIKTPSNALILSLFEVLISTLFLLYNIMLEFGNREVNVRIIFIGSPDFAVSVLELLVQDRHDIAAVYTRPDKPAGRGRDLQSTPVKQAALSRQIPLVQVPNFKAAEAVAGLERFRPEAIVVAAFGQILPPAVLNIPRYGCLNIHPSLLPRYRGPAPVVSTILAGDNFAGVSVMQLDSGMDSGPVFTRAQIPVFPWDTTSTLTPKLFSVGALMLLEVLAALPGGILKPTPQIDSQATVTQEVRKEDGRLDWHLPVLEIWRRVRAYQPWPETYTTWRQKIIKIIEATPVGGIVSPGVGRVVAVPAPASLPAAGFGIGAADGVLAVSKVQIEGKRAVPAAEFVRGQKDFLNSVLE
jgi:methionyl-tRNA formyltransferase